MSDNDAILAASATGYQGFLDANGPAGEQCLKVNLINHQALLPVQEIVEIFKLSVSEIVPIFQMQPWVMGAYNWRGEVLWIADLAHFLGFLPWYERLGQSAQKNIVVLGRNQARGTEIEEGKIAVGLLFDRIEDMIFCSSEDIHSDVDAIEVDSRVRSFMKGYWLDEFHQIYHVLDGCSLLEALTSVNHS